MDSGQVHYDQVHDYGETVHDTDEKLGPELDIGLGFAPNYGPDMGLADAHNTIWYAVGFPVIHVLLQPVRLFDDAKN